MDYRSDLLEEKEHLREMEKELHLIPASSIYIEAVCKIEALLFDQWIRSCTKTAIFEMNEAF